MQNKLIHELIKKVNSLNESVCKLSRRVSDNFGVNSGICVVDKNDNDDDDITEQNEIVPDFIVTLRPEMETASLCDAVYLWIISPTTRSYRTMPSKDTSKQSFFYSKYNTVVATYCKFMGNVPDKPKKKRLMSGWRKDVLDLCKSGLENIT